MPIYLYQNPKTGEIKEVAQKINEAHLFYEDGIEWLRIFTVPQLNTEGTLKADCTDKQFSEFTKNKKGSIGDLWDRSKELSDKRKKVYGQDPVKEKYKKDWSKKRKNRRFIE